MRTRSRTKTARTKLASGRQRAGAGEVLGRLEGGSPWTSPVLVSAKRDRVAAERASLLSLAAPPGPQDRRAFRAQERRWNTRFRLPDGVESFDEYASRLRIMPKAGGYAFAVLKLDHLAEIDPGDDFRDDFRRKAARGQRRFQVDAQPAGHDIASAVPVFIDFERKLPVGVDEKAGVAVVLLPLLRNGAG